MLFNPDDKHDMSHINLSRESDLILVSPATANILASMAHGFAHDLATNLLLAANIPIFVAPAMNVEMWSNKATKRNVKQLKEDGVKFIGPAYGTMACGETGVGRLAEPKDIVLAIKSFAPNFRPLAGVKVLVTSGPTHEPIDPVRYIANRSSGKQGHAIAENFARNGADVTLVSGPVNIADPFGVSVVKVETAMQMYEACQLGYPVDVVICAAAVADWRVSNQSGNKIKKQNNNDIPTVQFAENPDILKSLSNPANGKKPKVVVGFAAETDDILNNAQFKLENKGCDLIVANHVGGKNCPFGDDSNTVSLVHKGGIEKWDSLLKTEIAERLVDHVASVLQNQELKCNLAKNKDMEMV
jgi:phosphopantothenoylcysteine decarboxylase/phosphopantothenate--cysteine ligase